jgi:hypothetical protein
MSDASFTAAQSLVERLRAEAQRLSGSSLDRGCAGCGIAANVADNAADLIERLLAHAERAEAALREVEPYLDAIICYASTITEHEGNQVAALVCAALTPIPKETA